MSNNGSFTGKINGTGVHEMYEQFSKLKLEDSTHLEDRMSTVNAMMEYEDFFDSYFNDIFDPLINNDDPLATDGNVCLLLERMGDYLIKSEESKEMTFVSKGATIHTREALTRKMDREAGLSDIDASTISDSSLNKGSMIHNTDVLDNLKTDNPVVLEYLKYYQLLKHNLKYNVGKRPQILNDISRIKADIKYILNKDEINSLKNKVDGFNYVVHDVDFSDSEQLVNLMLNDVGLEQDSELWLAKEALNDNIKELKLYDNLKTIAELVLKGYNKKEMKRKLKLNSYGVNKLLQTLADYVIINENGKNKKLKESQ